MLVLPAKQRIVQPQSAVAIDTNNPIARGMVFCYLPGANVNLVNQSASAVKRDADTRSLGTALNTPGTASTNGLDVTASHATLLGALNESTIICFAATNAGVTGTIGTSSDGLIGASSNALYAERASTGNDIYKLGWAYTSSQLTAEFTYRNDAGVLLQQRVNIPGLNNGVPVLSAATKKGTSHTVYCKGLVSSGTYGSSSTAFTNSGLKAIINADYNDGVNSWNGTTYFVAGFSRALSLDELASLNNNPWQIFAPRRQWFTIDSAGATLVNASGVSATASVGDVTATGASSTTATGTSATASVGDVTATGASSTTATGTSATASVGDVTVTGASSTTATGVSATASVGDVTVTSTSAAKISWISFEIPPATATLVNATGVSATASVGDVTATGASSTTATGVSATASVGSVSITNANTVAVTGVSATTSVGDVTVSIPSSTTASGVSATGSIGSVSALVATNVLVTSVTATGLIGDPSVAIAATIDLTGVVGTSALGLLRVAVWDIINDNQTVTWQAVDDSESTIWTPVNDAQVSTWQNIIN